MITEILLFIFLSFIFFLGISLFICFLTIFKNNALYTYIATALIMLPLITFIVLYPYQKNIYNKKLFILIIIFAIIIFIPLLYFCIISKCICSLKERCTDDGKCESINVKVEPTPSGGSCEICGTIKCCDSCTDITIAVDGVETEIKTCCKEDQIIKNEGKIKCCGGGQVADDKKENCVSRCGNSKCQKGELCQKLKKPNEESKDDFLKRLKELLKGHNYEYNESNQTLYFCAKKNNCTLSFLKRYPSNTSYYYQDVGQTDCLKDLSNCTFNSLNVYYSGKNPTPSTYSSYISYDADQCDQNQNMESACLKEAILTTGATNSYYNPETNKCNILISGNLVNKFMNNKLLDNEICNSTDICMDNGKVIQGSGYVNLPNSGKCTISLGGVLGKKDCTQLLCKDNGGDFFTKNDNSCNNGGTCTTGYNKDNYEVTRNCQCIDSYKGYNCNTNCTIRGNCDGNNCDYPNATTWKLCSNGDANKTHCCLSSCPSFEGMTVPCSKCANTGFDYC